MITLEEDVANHDHEIQLWTLNPTCTNTVQLINGTIPSISNPAIETSFQSTMELDY